MDVSIKQAIDTILLSTGNAIEQYEHYFNYFFVDREYFLNELKRRATLEGFERK